MGPRIVVVLVLLAFGAAAAAADDVPLPRPRPQIAAVTEPHSFAEAAAGIDLGVVTAAASDCDKRLEAVATVTLLPRLIGPGECGGPDMVELDAVLLGDGSRVAVEPAPPLRCPMAEQLALWLREDAAPRLAGLGSQLRSVDNFDSFECRSRNRVFGAKLSEHGKGNAIDVRALTLADGRKIALTDPEADKSLREDLRQSACHRFSTVLGPGSDGYHEFHIHLDLAERHGGYKICEWDVREPPKVPLPRPRPAEIAEKP